MTSNHLSARNTRQVLWTQKELKTIQNMVAKHMEENKKMSDEDWENVAKALNSEFPESANRTAITVKRQWDIYGKRKREEKTRRTATQPWTEEEISKVLRLGNNKETAEMTWDDIASKFQNRSRVAVSTKYGALIAKHTENTSNQVQN